MFYVNVNRLRTDLFWYEVLLINDSHSGQLRYLILARFLKNILSNSTQQFLLSNNSEYYENDSH